MKRLFYFFLSLMFLPLSARTVQKSYTYYFNNPESLNPSITRSPYEGGSVSVTDMVFSSNDGNVNISFIKGSSPIGAEIITDNASGGKIPYLTFNTTVRMIISVANPETTQLLEVKSPSYDGIGGVYLQDITPTPDNPSDFQRDSQPDVDGIKYY